MKVKLAFGAAAGLLTAVGLAVALTVGVPAVAQTGAAASDHPASAVSSTASSTPSSTASSTPSSTPSPEPSPVVTCAIPDSQPVNKACNDYPPGPRQKGCPPRVTPKDPPIPFQRPPDGDVNGDGDTDWFIGQTTFVTDPGPNEKDLVVQNWCMQDPGHAPYYSVRVYASFGGKEFLALPITKQDPFHFCPFDGGENSGVTFPNGTLLNSLPDNSAALKTLPVRLDWISVNPAPDKNAGPDSPNRFEGQKTIIWIFPNKITKDGADDAVVAGQIRIPADATLDPKTPAQVPADAFGSVADTPTNMYVPLTGPQKPVTANDLTPEQKLELYLAATAEYTKLKPHAATAPSC